MIYFIHKLDQKSISNYTARYSIKRTTYDAIVIEVFKKSIRAYKLKEKTKLQIQTTKISFDLDRGKIVDCYQKWLNINC